MYLYIFYVYIYICLYWLLRSCFLKIVSKLSRDLPAVKRIVSDLWVYLYKKSYTDLTKLHCHSYALQHIAADWHCFDWERVRLMALGLQAVPVLGSGPVALLNGDSPEQLEKLEGSIRITRQFQTYQPPRNAALATQCPQLCGQLLWIRCLMNGRC